VIYFCLVLLDLCLKILKSDKSCPGAAQMIEWLKGVFDALDKKYVSCYTVMFETKLLSNHYSLGSDEFCSSHQCTLSSIFSDKISMYHELFLYLLAEQ
jgi:HORMA domain